MRRKRLTGQTKSLGEGELADAVLEVSIRANQEIVKELKGDESVCQALLEIMEPEINKIVREATERVRKETEERVGKEAEKRQAFDTAKIMISSGKFSAGEIVEYVPGISIEEVQSLDKRQMPARS